MAGCDHESPRRVFLGGAGECRGGDSNPYGLLHQILSLARLPISPPRPFGSGEFRGVRGSRNRRVAWFPLFVSCRLAFLPNRSVGSAE